MDPSGINSHAMLKTEHFCHICHQDLCFQCKEEHVIQVRKIVQMIGYPDWIPDTVQLDKYYQNASTVLSNGTCSIC